MQNFDPKIQSQDAQRSSPTESKDPVLRRRDAAGESDKKKKKKFSLEAKEGKGSTPEEKTVEKREEPQKASPFALVSGKKEPKEKQPEAPVLSAGSEKNVQAPFSAPAEMPGVQATQNTTPVPKAQKVDLEALVKQLVKAVTEVQREGKTETTITLQHPPLFAGAKITLTAFDSAKGEFNLSFSSLSNDAVKLIDNQLAKEQLLNNLAEKGYVVHIFTTTTQREELITTRSDEPDKERDEEQEKEEQEQ